MECRVKWSGEHVQRINSQWRQVIRATDPASSQLERIGALVVADRVLEYLLETINWSREPLGKKLTLLKGTIPDYGEFVRARDIRHNAVHEMSQVRHKRLLLALLEYQAVFEALGITLEVKIPLRNCATKRRTDARSLSTDTGRRVA